MGAYPGVVTYPGVVLTWNNTVIPVNSFTHTHTRTHAHSHTHACTHAHTHVHTHTHTHTHMLAHTRTHILNYARSHTPSHTYTCTQRKCDRPHIITYGGITGKCTYVWSSRNDRKYYLPTNRLLHGPKCSCRLHQPCL